jgi:DNA-binding CsgD family transcriptional regulator/tetratricopeptide (TPR) repeat protein
MGETLGFVEAAGIGRFSPTCAAGPPILVDLIGSGIGRRIVALRLETVRSAASTDVLPELLERSGELGTLAGLLNQVAATGSGHLCVIGGEAGVGKTALVRRFCNQQGATRVLWGACDPLFTPQPLGPLMDIASRIGGELLRLGGSRARPFEVASALLNELRGSAPAIVVLEDLQWADEATLDVMRLLSGRVESASALVIATYRDDELGRVHPLRFLLGEMPRHESVSRIKLQPLSAAAVATMAGGAGVDAGELYRKTAGNPFFVTEALASAHEEQIPPTVRDAVLARAARLSPQARELLDAAAVVPQQAELWLLEAVSPEQFPALGECLDSGMLARQNGSVAFRHELARLAIDESIPPDRALQLHRLTLSALAKPSHGTPDVTRLAHHAEAAGDDSAMLRFGRAAGELASALGAHREAAAQFTRSLRVAELLPPGEHADLFQLLAQERLHTNQADLAIEAQGRAINLYKGAGDSLNWADALRRQSRLFMCGGRGAEAEEPILKAIEILEKLPRSRELALAYSGLVMLYMNHDNADGVIRIAPVALDLAEQVGDSETVLHTLNSLGTTELLKGDPRGKEKLVRSLEMAEELGMDEHVGRAYINLADASVQARMYDGLVELISRGADFSREHGLELWRMWLLSSLAKVYLARGDWSRAVEVAEAVLNGEMGQLPRVAVLPTLALVRARRGDPDVWPLLDEAQAMAEREGELQFAVPVSTARAEAAWLEGRIDAIAGETDAAFQKATRLGAWWQVGEMLRWRRRAGLQDELHPMVPERYKAELQSDWARAAELWSALGCEYDAALALAGADDDELLRRSLSKLQRLGARATAAVVARKLRARGAQGISRGPRMSTQRNAAQLTARELEVLDLVKSGMKNAEIATRLFLAPKTVDHHVSAILRKLAVESRSQAAREATRLGLLN